MGELGSTDGGDQAILNDGLCPHWHTGSIDAERCDRLPWIYNVYAGDINLFTLIMSAVLSSTRS
jgi:hypothetical protein